MVLSVPALALALAACPAPGGADAAVRGAGELAPDADLAVAAEALAWCGPEASTPELRARAQRDLAAVRRVAEAERRAALIYPAGGRVRVEAELDDAAGEVRERADLLARLAADARAMARADEALSAAEDGRWAAAGPLLDRALADPAVGRVAGAERLGELTAAVRRAAREAGPWAGLRRAGLQVGALLAAFAGAVLALGAVRLATGRTGRERAPRYDIALVDGEGGASAGLALLLLGELRGMRTVPTVTAEPAGELGSVAVLRAPALGEELRRLAAHLDRSAALSVGFLRLPLRDLWLGLTRLLFPARYTWRGALTRHRDETRFALQQLDRRTGRRREWSSRAAGTDARGRAEAVREMAYRVALAGISGTPPTGSEEAFAAHQAAGELLEGSPESASRPRREEARVLLERAVREDPAWEAPQVRLAGVLSRLGLGDQALEMITGLSRADPAPRPDLLYEEARICAQSGDARRLRRALALAEEVLRAGVSSELELNARSLRAAAAAGLLGLCERGEAPLSETGRGRLQEALTEELAFLADDPPPGIDARAFSLARGLALAARGGWLVEAGRAREALAAFREVLVAQPDLLAAQLGIARAYRKAQPPGWFEQAVPWLERAERLAPGGPAAHYEHGSALLAHRPRDVLAAEEHLRKAAGQVPGALFKLGVLLAEELDRTAEGLRCLDRALEARGARSAPYWAEKLVQVAAAEQPLTPLAADLADKALAGLAQAYAARCPAEDGEDPDAREGRLLELRRLRRYLARAAAGLGEALAVPPAAGAPPARRERDRAAATLRRTLAALRAELASPGLEERDRVALERAVARIGPRAEPAIPVAPA
ncbi:MAG TPA: hypothetical protein VMU15_06860 [Anaeromyxobacter sp.]|nr:hypothetical protein [Anaeromyxobacter sp.]